MSEIRFGEDAVVSVLQRLFRSLEFRLGLPLGAVVVLVVAAHAILGYLSIRQQASGFVRADLERSTALIESATHDGMLLNRMSEVQSRIERLGVSPGFTGVRVYSKSGRIALSSDAGERDLVVGISAPACVPCHPGRQARGPGVLGEATLVQRQDGQESQRRLTVIRNEASCSTAGCHAGPDQVPVLGVLEVGMTMAPFDRAIARARHELAGTTAALILAGALVTALVVRRLVHVPVARLPEGPRRSAAGDLSTRIEISGRDQLAALAGAFNTMVGDLRAAQAERQQWSRTIEEKVEQKTKELREAQRQMIRVETMVSLGKLSATVAHELNNPLSGILAYTRLVRRELAEQPIEPALRQELDGYLSLVDKESLRCGGIVKNLLVFARGSSSRPAPVNLNEIVVHSLMLVRHHLEVHRIRSDPRLIEGDPVIVADQGQVQQAVLALLMNAIEAMQGISGREAVLGVHLGGDEQRVRLSISDTGVGIDPAALPHIFEPFFTTKGEKSGVGLGLSVVYGVVHAHGGEIGVESRPDAGTTFLITLPRRAPNAPTEPGAVLQGAEVPA